MIEHRFGETWVIQTPGYTTTRLPGGAEVTACHGSGYPMTADLLGYPSVVELDKEHDAAHAFLAEKLGLPESPTLRWVAEGSDPACEPEVVLSEEGLVLDFQHYLNDPDFWSPRFDPLVVDGHPLAQWREEFLGLFRGEPAS